MLVLAPPGSGKTLTITHRIARLLRSKEAAAESVLALTFTERAASELAARLHALSLHGVTARTFHGHCSTLLRTHHREAGFSEAFSVFTDQQLEQAQMEAIGSLRLSRLPGRHVGSIRRTLSQYVCEPLSLEEAALRSSLSILQFEALIERYEAIKREQKAIDFDDLIVRTANLLWNTSEVADSIHDRCRFVFVDEFQDVSPEQLRLLNALAPHQLDNRQVVVVADENQSIYAFRGADPGTMLRRYRELYRPSEFTLEENRRSVASIVRAAQRLMRAADADERSKPWRGEGHRVLGFACDHEVHEADYVAHLVERAIGEGFSPSHIAVLYRRHERGEVIENALLKRSIRLFRVQKGRFYDLPDVQETIRSLELVTSSQDRSFVNAVNWPRFLVDELTMISLRRITEDLGIGLAAIGEQREILRERCSPLTATIVEQFFADVVHPVRAMESEEPARVVEGMLDLL
ncbi:MAG: ATP-dependent helicase, partial [Thermomicrobiales bacterium]